MAPGATQRVRNIALLLSLLVFVISVTAPVDTVAQTGLLWSAGHEAGTSADWWAPEPAGVEGNNCGGEYNNSPATSTVSTVRRTGQYGMALRVPNLNTGSSLGARLFRWCEAQQQAALYYSGWYLIPQHVTVGSWWHIMEWKSAGSVNAKFALAVGNRPNGEMYVGLERGVDSGGGFWSQSVKDIPVGQWFHLEAYYKKATNGTGRVTVWQDGVQTIDLAHVRTANSSDLAWAIINYGQDTSPSDVTIHIDDAAISTTRQGTGIPTSTPTSTPTLTPTATATTATPTATATPTTAPAVCSPRPPVTVLTSRGAPGQLNVTIEASTTSGAPNNRLRELVIGPATNATIVVRGTSYPGGSATVSLPDRPQQVTFTVHRQTSGTATTVPLIVVDDCLGWSTLVGGGPGAF
jgi:hypothetical protein